jgi:hypothetical protein
MGVTPVALTAENIGKPASNGIPSLITPVSTSSENGLMQRLTLRPQYQGCELSEVIGA